MALTRAREGLTIITSDAASLQKSIGVSGERQSAMELARHAALAPVAKEVLHEDNLFQLYQAHRAEQHPAIQKQVFREEFYPNGKHTHSASVSAGL